MMTTHRLLSFAAITLWTIGGCASDSGPDACDHLQEKLVECGALTQGTWNCWVPTTHEGRCAMTCAAEASCTEAQDLACSSTWSDDVAECAAECARATCSDGSEITKDQLCDGAVHCPNASDERACPGQFVCADGLNVYPDSFKCDGLGDCSDNSDELGCVSQPPTSAADPPEDLNRGGPAFTCADGQGTVPSQFLCDDVSDCGDGSDQRGCLGWRTCSDGSRTIQDFRFCDTLSDCDDGGDEEGCAVLNCDPAAVLDPEAE